MCECDEAGRNFLHLKFESECVSECVQVCAIVFACASACVSKSACENSRFCLKKKTFVIIFFYDRIKTQTSR